MAVHAEEVLEARRIHATLDEAVADCALVVGTTSEAGPYRDLELPPALAPEILAVSSSQPVALVFGPEDHGLSNHDLRLVDRVVGIPTEPAYRSLNLAQAVAILLYELRRGAALHSAEVGPAEARVSAGERDFLLARLRQAFLRLGYVQEHTADHILATYRQIFGRAGLGERDLAVLLGLARQVEWFATGGVPPSASPPLPREESV